MLVDPFHINFYPPLINGPGKVRREGRTGEENFCMIYRGQKHMSSYVIATKIVISRADKLTVSLLFTFRQVK